MKNIFLSLVICTLYIPWAHTQQIDYKGFPEWSWHKEGNTEYYFYTPSNAKPGVRYPIAIFLHGCCGEDDHATLRNAVDPPVRIWHDFGANSQREPTYIVAPKTTQGWEHKFRDIKKIVDDLIIAGKADPQRIYMTGFSMGGAGIWQFLERYPGYIAAAVPMGSGIRADIEKVKNTPVWAIRGEYDYFAQKLDSQVAVMRSLNGFEGGSMQWITAVNPLFTSFGGMGHGIQWDAVSELTLLDWLYSNVNDGNIPPVVYFSSPAYKKVYSQGDFSELEIRAHDPDGSIKKILLKMNHREAGVFEKSTVKTSVLLQDGDNLIEAIAVDNAAKTAVARIIVRTDNKPVITTSELPDGKAGSFYFKELFATGNFPVKFTVSDNRVLPEGLRLVKGKIIKGIPEKPGDYPVSIIAIDEDGDSSDIALKIHIREKDPGEVLLTNVHSVSDTLINLVSKMMVGELPNTQAGTEVFFSDVADFAGFSFISTSVKQADISSDKILSFHTDQEVTVYVAYEKLDNLFTSGIPSWLSDFEKVPCRQIIAQYHYFDVYRKNFSNGEVNLPGGESSKNNVICNYFVMVAGKDTVRNTKPEITSKQISPIITGNQFSERFTALEGEGKLNWTIQSGKLPEGLTLNNEGLLSGTTYVQGEFRFVVQVEDAGRDKDSISVNLKINRKGTGKFDIKD
jgi:predicted esterase